jgi:hypothetical protein
MFHNKEDDRFEVTFTQSKFAEQIKILRDKDTGINYLVISQAYGCGLTPLLDGDGKPVKN